MIKEVEKITKNNKTQYVDWETGEELFKKSDCIPVEELKHVKFVIERYLNSKKGEIKDFDNIDIINLITKVEFINELLRNKNNLDKLV